jgi:pyruvate/2-oxoglutarate dehydrogenase complex dihydrolipoamide acyltransferase (E2) component
MLYKLMLPELGALEELKVLQWHAAPDAEVADGALLVELEIEKAILEIRTGQVAFLRKQLTHDGDWHNPSTPLAILSTTPDEAIPADLQSSSHLLLEIEAV